MSDEINQYISALINERDYVAKGIVFKVLEARRENQNVVVHVEPQKKGASRSSAIDESLEGCRAVWGEIDAGNKAEVLFVDSDDAALILRFLQGALPSPGETIRLFPQDFLTPLIALWHTREHRQRAERFFLGSGGSSRLEHKALSSLFSSLRVRQADALQLSLNSRALLIGPPGTGKTYTVGAIVAHLLARFKNSRVLLIGPTNVAVDTALISVDDWLARIERSDLRPRLKRIGSRFDSKKYSERSHLLAPGIAEAATDLDLLQLEEPSKKDVAKHAAWKEKLEKARAALKADIAHVASEARSVAVTTATAFNYYETLRSAGPWPFIICDEASQVMLPSAVMVGALGERVLYAGDPNQLAPIVQSPDKLTEVLLAQTAFDLNDMQRVLLSEQSRMCREVCETISNVFYRKQLTVCKKAANDRAWVKERSPFYIGGREVPRVLCEMVDATSKWSPKYNGLIRYETATLTTKLVQALRGSYADERDILVLTPFRAQRALMRGLCKDGAKDVRISTVHRSQGTECKIVIFDPVAAQNPFLNSDNGRRLINVALSRAQAHVVLLLNQTDLINEWIAAVYQESKRWHKAGDYARPFSIQ